MKATTKRLWVLLTALVLLVSVLGMTVLAAEATDESVCYVHGDVNGDGVIDSRDAIRTLFYALWNDSVSVNQDCDFNEDDAVTQKDAIYLLFVSLGMDGYESKGTVHTYLEPVWHWDTAGAQPVAQVSLQCACGTPHPVTEGIAITAGQEKAPTCVADGFKKYTAKVTYDGTEYEDTVTVTVAATGDGHSFAAAPTCEAGVKCVNCDFTKPALGHSYALSGEREEGCKHIKQYKCATCGNVVDGTAASDVYYTHSYTAKLTKEATCTQVGEQTLTCACGDVQTEEIPVNETFHVWNEGEKEGNVTTYTCKHNASHTKTVVEMNDDGVSAEALKENEVKLDEAGTSVSLDEATANQLGEAQAVKITVSEVNKEELVLDEEKKEQIGDAKVYDFSMLSDNNKVSTFDGKVTVSLPYELQPGEDVNDIDVWFIDDEGNVTSQEGVYNNGFVTFQVEHFSYYTVTRMTPAERCARYGHNMIEQNKAVTCTADGYAKKFCLRCGMVEKNETIAMLGHDYQKDTAKSVAATCDSHGTEVSVCANCQAEKTEEVKQLTHKWEKTQTVAPTCTAKGYEKMVCQLCEAEKNVNEQAATGHSYVIGQAGWQWADDYSGASVTLSCEHSGCTSTKTLEAVVTKKLDGSVCLGGDATYTAVAAHNNKEYKDTVTGKESGAGQHNPGGKWETTDTQHYQLCTVCGEKVGIADHDWVRTVTQAATCNKAGKATEKCSVCDKEREVILPATGEHTLVGGVCSGCGYTEGDCQHKKLTTTQVDLSTYGACGGTIYVQSCSCGKIRRVSGANFQCEMTESDDSDEENYIYKYTSTCATCGLVAEQNNYRVMDQATCSGRWVVEWTISMGNTQILHTVDNENYTFYHPVVVKSEPVSFATYGLCGGTFHQESCYCGANSSWISDGDVCKWEYDDAANRYTCATCGAVATMKTTEGKVGCTYSVEAVLTIQRAGYPKLEVVNREVSISHSYVIENIERYGDSCEDGYYLERVCSVCGAEEKDYYDWCATVVPVMEVDTSGAGSCSEKISVRTCPCGQETSWYYDGYINDGHEWEYDYDYNTGMSREYCAICGFYSTSDYEIPGAAEKDENCCVEYDAHYIYTNGKVSFNFTVPETQYYHDWDYEFILKGESCEDGVTINQTCKDCRKSSSRTTNYHSGLVLQSMDLTGKGYCNDYIELYGCACGESLELYDYNCNWIQRAGDEGYEEFYCYTCKMKKTVRWTDAETDNPCVTKRSYTVSYYNGEQLLGTIEYDGSIFYHRYVYTMTLNEGAVTCEDGWTAKGKCLTCGKTQTTGGYGCSSYPVQREIVDNDALCGPMDLVLERCACGECQNRAVMWVGQEHCDFYSGEQVYDAQYGAWRYYCAGCGCSYLYRTTKRIDPNDPCSAFRTEKQIYLDPDGKQIAEAETTYKTENHDWLSVYTLLGESCEDGWRVSLICAECEATRNHGEGGTGCEINRVSRELVYNNENTCGPVYVYHSTCACGAEERYFVEDSCNNGSWNNGRFTCSDCGMVNTNSTSYSRIPGTCRSEATMEYVYYIDSKEVARVEKTYELTDHVAVFSFQMLGESCEDGYRVYEDCVYCDYSDYYGNYSGHNSFLTEYYEFPEGCCEGNVKLYSCPCGEQSRVEYNNYKCNTVGSKSWEETDGNGIVHSFYEGTCRTCGITSKQEYYYTDGASGCQKILHQKYSWEKGDWKVSLQGNSTSYQHTYRNTKLTLTNSDNCEDGVDVERICVKCGTTQTTIMNYGHPTMAVETIDLAQYGSVCGAKLKRMECACGKSSAYELSADTLCDLDQKDIPHFVEGTLDGSEYCTEGWLSTWSYSYSYICSVTEPKCDLSIRQSTYWLAKDCVATEYETWQLGYDSTTDTCQREITVPTGRTRTWHDYQYSYVSSPEGVSPAYSGAKYTCKCGSYYTELSYYNEEGNQAKFERHSENTLQNGEKLERTEIWERVYYYGIQFTSAHIDRWVNADGTEGWSKYEYTYDFTNGCYRDELYTDSDGNRNETKGAEAHATNWKTIWDQNATCTQHGAYREVNICQVCQTVVQEDHYQADPTAHDWNWVQDRGCYVCSVCDLESATGASGGIVMEDLTEENGADYVIGYWNRDDVAFNPYVSVVLYDVAEDEEDEKVLDVSVKMLTVDEDGVCGMSFNKAQAEAAAKAALGSYTGSYAVRISCVPLGGGNTLDYAITFDTLTAE